MALESVTINEGTQTPIASDNISGTAFQVMKINTGGDGTVGSLWDGNVNVVSGTTAANVLSGTINSIPNIPGGTVGLLSMLSAGTVSMLNAGTVTSVGTVPGVGVVTDLTSGSVRITVGTITVLPNIPGGTVGLVTTVTNLSNGTIQSSGTTTGVGTVSAIGQIHNAGTIAAMPNIPGGTVGLVTTVTNLSNGTIQSSGTTTGVGVVSMLSAGTISTLNNGTVQINPKPTKAIITYGTTVGGTAAVGVTLLAAPGAGTSIYLNEVSVVNQGTAALTCHIGFGTASTLGTSHVLGGVFAANGGVQKSYPTPVGGHIANLALLGSVGAVGTVNVNLSYWVE